MNRRHFMAILGAATAAAMFPASSQAQSFFDALQKSVGNDSKQGQLIKGIGTLLSSGQDMDYKSERTIGESLALEGFKRYGMPLEDEYVQKYVNLLGLAIARDSTRPDITYQFVVVKNPIKNAFSCPGGIIFVSSGLIAGLDSEAQLACVLAHEVAHVAHRDALQSIKQAKFFEGVSTITAATMKGDDGKQFQSMIGNLQKNLFERGLDHSMEFRADISAMETAYRAGYSPVGMLQTLELLKKEEPGQSRNLKGSWYTTHPPLSQRIAKCRKQMEMYPDWKELRTTTGRLPWYQARMKKA